MSRPEFHANGWHRRRAASRDDANRGGGIARPRLGVTTVLSGIAALVWLLLRSGPKPSRLTYPCQQAAISAATLVFGIPAVAAIIACRRYIAARLRTVVGKLAACTLVTLGVVMISLAGEDQTYRGTLLTPPAAYTPHVYLVNDAGQTAPDRFPGIDNLISLMGMNGLKWHRSVTTTMTSGPDGMIDADDVVLIKINAQWSQRGGTNTDVLRGVIRRIVEHPDGFSGEVVVVDNGQGGGSLDYSQSNAEIQSQSTLDVVNDFALEGWNVSAQLWDALRSVPVGEYADGNMTSGYVVNSVRDPETNIAVSYPKFQTPSGTYVSYKHGVWSPALQSYDPGKLVVINIPVLKTHFLYGITGSVKNHMGVVTRDMNTDSHNAVGRGGMGSVLAEVRMPDLTILDCIWILARPGQGPIAYYTTASRRDQLLAGTDPVALDAWAAKYVMMPQIVANGYTPADYDPGQNPDNPNSSFRRYLDLSMNELLAAGIETTNDYNAVVLHTWNASSEPLPATPPHDARKNRYVSFIPFAVGPTAFEIEMTAGPGPLGVLGWVGEPVELAAGKFVSQVVAAPFFSDAWPAVLHVGDCEIVPVATYEIRATTDEVIFTDPLQVGTILKPFARYYGDVVGEGTGNLPPEMGFTGPNGVVNVADIQSFVLTAQGDSSPSAHITWIDLYGDGIGTPPDLFLNVADLQRIQFGYMGYRYTDAPEYVDPADCP